MALIGIRLLIRINIRLLAFGRNSWHKYCLRLVQLNGRELSVELLNKLRGDIDALH